MNTKNILNFLTELDKHNTKEWMDANKSWYQECRADFLEFVEGVIQGVAQFDESIGDLKAHKCIFRINRDVRFSKNKNPYKTNFGSAMGEGGRNSGNPIYYFHLEPGNSFIAGGLYMPEAESLKKIRQEIDYNPEELKKIASDKAFLDAFGSIQGETLKTAPKGYPKDHPNIELLRHKSFILVRDLSEQDIASPDLSAHIVKHYALMKPFNDYLSVAIS